MAERFKTEKLAIAVGGDKLELEYGYFNRHVDLKRKYKQGKTWKKSVNYAGRTGQGKPKHPKQVQTKFTTKQMIVDGMSGKVHFVVLPNGE